jgi:L-ascorbate metabolism protein UlaG (beta-lactamase superfamily)
VFCFTVEGLKVCHLGDLGHELTPSEISEIAQVDVLMLPVGGLFTIDAATATGICSQVKPSVAIPMHFKTAKCDFPISEVGDFLEGKPNVRRAGASEVELKQGQLPEATEIVVLEHAM